MKDASTYRGNILRGDTATVNRLYKISNNESKDEHNLLPLLKTYVLLFRIRKTA